MSWHTTKLMGKKTADEMNLIADELKKKNDQMNEEIYKKFCESKDAKTYRQEQLDLWVAHQLELNALLKRFEKIAEERGDFIIPG